MHIIGIAGSLIGAARTVGMPGLGHGRNLEIDGRVALVTGAASGIGLAVAHELLERGARVGLLDYDERALKEAAADLPADRMLAVAVDVRDRAAMREAVADTVARFGALDIVVANAGVVSRFVTLRKIDPDEYDRVIAINQTGVFNTVHPAIEPIIAAGGHIVVVASVAALIPGPGAAPYAISKAGVEQLGRALRFELNRHGASAGVAYFGFVDTNMVHTTLDDDPLLSQNAQTLPGPFLRRITAQRAAEAIADGIAKRAGRTIAPAVWRPVAALRGVISLADDVVAADTRARTVLDELETRA